MNLDKRNLEMQQFFNEKASTYDDVHQKFIQTKNLIADNLDNNPKDILDLGVGTGLELINIFKKYKDIHITGIDISKEMLNILKTREFINNIDIIIGDFFKVPFTTNNKTFDAVISTSTLHHFTKEDKLILYKKIYNVLNNKGIFINADKLASNKLEEEFYFKDYNIQKRIVHYDTPLCLDSELDILKKAGFTNILVKDCYNENYKLIKAIK